MPIDRTGTEKIEAYVSPRLKIQLKQIAVFKGAHVSDIVRDIMEDYVAKEYPAIQKAIAETKVGRE